ncbi:16S rRNA (guanine(966)-N(2))-methyltransferase RsmD [Parasphingopyxis marina]|uniref:16S rRNA (Guanine(966)-N(2))-methyltransferase RsmD n=1 Tax=Parasphingopyxis marina TaxID=2761622 RepID=A0A842HZJ8_9SPHN|nr:16S rRNA (guanine(966)-N(2))-methyltransferase RsmD [Parasphingopyxis marina]MBC2777967.1 16S rRNA (guanine(966)-N(2))-methyltransferase RsmD [Parasphingopyxis marina]
MRIISGGWRGRKLVAPEGQATRPTADRVREALFSMLQSRIGSFEGLRIADIFAGSGALGLEALSRGAAHCTFVEQDRAAIAALRVNIDALEASADIRAALAESIGSAVQPCDVIFLDPPYRSGLAETALPRLLKQGWMSPSCWISIETERDENIEIPGFSEDVTRAIGKAQITLLRPAS